MANKDDPDVTQTLAEFKAELKKVLRPEDVEGHFDMAVAFAEMGLVEEALSELDVVERGGCLNDKKLIGLLLLRAQAREAQGDIAGALLD